MLRKNWSATGSFLKEDRPQALDLLGVASQLVFNTFLNGYFARIDHGGDPDLAYGVARAHNRAMTEFCAVDRRLLATGYVPLADFERARAMAAEAIAGGARALLVPSRCPRGHAPSHIALDPVWAIAQEAGLPIVFHVGGGGWVAVSPEIRAARLTDSGKRGYEPRSELDSDSVSRSISRQLAGLPTVGPRRSRAR